MTTHVISFFADDTARASFENHRRYCARLAYPHEYVDTAAIGWAHLRMLLKYQVLLRKLRACAEGDLVLLITQDCLLLRDIPCETLMRGENRDWIVSYRDDDPGDVMAAFQLWRNTAAAREQVQRICEGARFGRALASEAQLLSALGPRPFTEAIEGHHPVVLAALNVSPIWAEWPAFSLALADMPDAPKNQPVFADSRHLLDCATINTPYQLQSRDSFMVHYMHMWPSLRALIMHHGDLTSQMRGARRP